MRMAETDDVKVKHDYRLRLLKKRAFLCQNTTFQHEIINFSYIE